eukprot:6591715-Pyramimonas_sp.AAC.1
MTGGCPSRGHGGHFGPCRSAHPLGRLRMAMQRLGLGIETGVSPPMHPEPCSLAPPFDWRRQI